MQGQFGLTEDGVGVAEVIMLEMDIGIIPVPEGHIKQVNGDQALVAIIGLTDAGDNLRLNF